MRRRRRFASSSSIVELFPFLSILVCVIGIIILQIVGSSLARSGEDDDSSCGLQVCCEERRYVVENGDAGPWDSVGRSNSGIARSLDQVVHNEFTHLVLLVTPKGYRCFAALRGKAQRLGIALSYEPVDQCPDWARDEVQQ